MKKTKSKKAGLTKETVILQNAETDSNKIEYASSSIPGTRSSQQDALYAGIGNTGVTYGVLCDGMGGLENGTIAANTAVDAFKNAIDEMEPNCDIPDFLRSCMFDINYLINQLTSDCGDKGMSGTTLVAAVITDDDLYWVSIGDSRVYIIREREIVCVTADHSFSLILEAQVSSGQISAEDAANDPDRDALISFLGIDFLELIDVNENPFKLKPDDVVLMCSDGLYRSLSDEDIVEVLMRHKDNLDECAAVLPLYAFDKSTGSQDNTSVILLRKKVYK